MDDNQKERLTKMEEQLKYLTKDVKDLKCDFKQFPKMLDDRLEVHSNNIKRYLDNSVESHLRNTGSKMFTSRFVQTLIIPFIFICLGGLAVWIFELALKNK